MNLERELKGDCPIMYFIIVFKNMLMMGTLLKSNEVWFFFLFIYL